MLRRNPRLEEVEGFALARGPWGTSPAFSSNGHVLPLGTRHVHTFPGTERRAAGGRRWWEPRGIVQNSSLHGRGTSPSSVLHSVEWTLRSPAHVWGGCGGRGSQASTDPPTVFCSLAAPKICWWRTESRATPPDGRAVVPNVTTELPGTGLGWGHLKTLRLGPQPTESDLGGWVWPGQGSSEPPGGVQGGQGGRLPYPSPRFPDLLLPSLPLSPP